eukprot:11811285-Prorocentrum_lima.AAC.1
MTGHHNQYLFKISKAISNRANSNKGKFKVNNKYLTKEISKAIISSRSNSNHRAINNPNKKVDLEL